MLHRAQSWLSYGGPVRLLCGIQAHKRWHYTRAGQPGRFVRWWVRSRDAPKMETIMNLGRSLVAWLTCSRPSWTLEAEEAEAEAAEAKADERDACEGPDAIGSHPAADARSVSSSVASARRLRRTKRQLAVLGLCGVYVVWCACACMQASICFCIGGGGAGLRVDASTLTRTMPAVLPLPQGNFRMVHLHLCAALPLSPA
jgi:hypothetical protein